LQSLSLLKETDLAALGHNSPAYIHVLTEAIKLAMSDRDAYYGDPRFVEVPMEALLSDAYAANRRAHIDANRANPEMPPPGTPAELGLPADWVLPRHPEPQPTTGIDLDTSYICVVDAAGNAFSATPSDGSYSAPVIPGAGFVASPRGSQSWTDPEHPSCMAPGKRPRLTPNPALAVRAGKQLMPFGTPGGDVQIQAMLQTFLNVFVFGMEPQAAVEAPRFASYCFPNSFEPHDYHPGLLRLEGRIDDATGAALDALGHRIEWWPDMIWLAGSMGAIVADRETGVIGGAADPRRMAYAVGW
jgi:gamma-glutamyltranspeptidase/glutathione hydrolase